MLYRWVFRLEKNDKSEYHDGEWTTSKPALEICKALKQVFSEYKIIFLQRTFWFFEGDYEEINTNIIIYDFEDLTSEKYTKLSI